jgi:hypothetical protein
MILDGLEGVYFIFFFASELSEVYLYQYVPMQLATLYP